MGKGSCLCGKVGITYTQEPALKALCHCKDCHKTSGSAFSTNVIIPKEGFEVTGSPKVFTKTADSGKKINSYFCGDCGSTLYRDGENFDGNKIVKAGVLDDEDYLEAAKPGAELYAPLRPSWQAEVAGAKQLKGME